MLRISSAYTKNVFVRCLLAVMYSTEKCSILMKVMKRKEEEEEICIVLLQALSNISIQNLLVIKN